MSHADPTGPGPGKTDDALLRKARAAVEKERLRAAADEASSANRRGAGAAFVARLIERCAWAVRVATRPFGWLASLARSSGVRRIGRAFAWCACERESGRFRLDRDGRRIISVRRLTASVSTAIVVLVLVHVAVSAAYYYATRFQELVFVTGKQEIEPGERYQFTGCTALPCTTQTDNGKYYTIESSLYFPTLIYPEQDVFANIPQHNAACDVRGYGLYFRSLRWLYKSAQWYQTVYEVSCRPYHDPQLGAGVGVPEGR